MIEEGSGQDSYVASQIAARDRQAVAKISFLNFRSRYPSGLIFAVEGDDDKIAYSYWIQRVAPDLAYEFFVCSGKREVKKLRNVLARDLSNANEGVAFLVDRDFDELEGFESIDFVFMLDRYSIENYLVDRQVLDETIKVAFPGSGDRAMREKVCMLFEADYADFLQIASELNRRIFFARRVRVEIDNYIPTSLAKLAAVELGHVQPCNPPAEEAIALPILGEATQQLEEEFKQLDPGERYRGKFAYKFFRGWLDRLCDEYRNARHGLFPPPIGQDAKLKHDEMSLGSLASRSPLPEGFAAFLAKCDRAARL
ncbi:DUF4435 domain-containing protein [Sphingomonas sp.]|jgi:hypothetical protein|uniref:DUF4435 domain-containing protein n=1 Tax=Sphingomonas sp. TaxID=28214 RepID=UPI002DE4193D|nr:DUF4435 domain-containing protein [Sphingomonas sp.]